jgi:serine/threonine protein kinase/Tfp pilus assembly protein PilF
MDDKWQKVREIFDAALRYPPGERHKFIIASCRDDKELLAEVESLISSLNSADSFMETPAVAQVADLLKPETKKFQTGTTFGHYEIIRQIGAGGMGEVYLAKDKKLDRKVAVKILNEQFSKHESNLQRFIREAKSASGLNHPNILVVHEVGECEGAHYIVSEFIQGKTLRERLKESGLPLAEVLDIAIQTANALAAAHEAHLVHRDIKPENIMIRPDGFVKILDFGLAKLVEQKNNTFLGLEDETVQQQNPTAKGVILGTIKYMSPEQARGLEVDARTDIWSLGICLYEMLTGITPFAGETTSDTISRILKENPAPLAQSVTDIPKELERIVLKTLRKDRERRYHHVTDLLIDLKDFKKELEFNEKLERSTAPSKNEEATAVLPAVVTEAENAQTTSSAEYIIGEIKRHKRESLTVLTILLASTLVLGYWFFSNGAAQPPSFKQIKSIAVLPLENLSGDAAQDYFADGMTEALISNLSQLGSLKVISRTTVMKYKKSGKSIPEIAKELGVDGIIEGSVQRAGDRIRINTQLIYAATDSPVWSKNYERSVSDILKLESEIAQAVAGEIRIQLTPEQQQQFGKIKSIDPRATEAFLLGRHYFNMWTEESERQAVEQFQKAVSIEPEYADAWAGLADAWTVRAMVGDIPIPEAEKPTRDAATRALEIDPQNSAAHVSMCFIYNNYDFDWARSENECKRGLELDPNNAKGHFAYAYMLARVERWDEVFEQMKTTISLDPANPWWTQVYGGYLMQARQFEEAERQLKRAIEIDPNWRFAYWGLCNLYIELGRFDEALKLAEKWRNDSLFMAYVYARMGNRQKALEFLKKSANPDLSALAQVYTALGDFDKAFEAINQSLDRREGFMFGYTDYPVLDKLKSDPRWKNVARRMNQPSNPN